MPGEDSSSSGQDFVLAQGVRDTKGALAEWSERPGPVVGPWFAGSFLIAIGLLLAVWVISLLSTPDLSPFFVPGVSIPADAREYAYLLSNNMLVLALHATACVAGFIAGAALPLAAKDMTGFSKFVHEKAGPLAIIWVVLVTTFSLFAQAFALGFDGATLADQLEISSGLLIVTVLPHAVLELTAVFLPLAAWLVASRRDGWEELLAATFVTVALAVPMLLAAAAIELYIWPQILTEISPALV
jgi:hypothetical protein